MPWPFNRQRNRPETSVGTIEAIYGMIVAQARSPVFYQALGVPDTVNGRFDMIVLHLWMVLRRLRAFDGQEQFSQALFDHFCSDMDANLREMGVGDLTVPKRMVAFGEAFYGRGKAYDAAIEQGANRLPEALAKNVMSTTDPERARALAAYVTSAIERLDRIELSELRGGLWQFASPSAAPASA